MARVVVGGGGAEIGHVDGHGPMLATANVRPYTVKPPCGPFRVMAQR